MKPLAFAIRFAFRFRWKSTFLQCPIQNGITNHDSNLYRALQNHGCSSGAECKTYSKRKWFQKNFRMGFRAFLKFVVLRKKVLLNVFASRKTSFGLEICTLLPEEEPYRYTKSQPPHLVCYTEGKMFQMSSRLTKML